MGFMKLNGAGGLGGMGNHFHCAVRIDAIPVLIRVLDKQGMEA